VIYFACNVFQRFCVDDDGGNYGEDYLTREGYAVYEVELKLSSGQELTPLRIDGSKVLHPLTHLI
jgi:hypothetical protein